jgi:hypothetical protein
MASRPAFHASLQLKDPRIQHAEGKNGPSAGGPIEPGDKVMWVYAWIIQNGDDKGETWAAAADGESPDGKTFTDEWHAETEMTDGSDPFRPGTAAVATAMALIDRQVSGREIYWWTDAVTFKPPSAT